MATRPSKTAISKLLEEYAQLETRRINVELKRDRELAPHKATFEKKVAPILEDANSKIASLRKRQAVIESAIKAQLLAGVDEKAETVALSEVAVEYETTKSIAAAVAEAADSDSIATAESGAPIIRAVARVDAKPGSREIEPQKFFDAVEASKRTGAFWSCVKVLMGEADKFLGKVKADALAKSKKKYDVTISLKP